MTSRPPSGDSKLQQLGSVWIDALTYALAFTAVLVALTVVLGIATGGGLLRAKHLLFVFGWMILAYATAKMWLKSGKQLKNQSGLTTRTTSNNLSDDSDSSSDSKTTASSLRNRLTTRGTRRGPVGKSLRQKQDRTAFQRLVQRLPPNRWVQPPRPHDRLTIPGKLFLAGLFVLAVSYVMETVFGIT